VRTLKLNCMKIRKLAKRRVEVFIPVVMMSTIFWDIMLYSPLKANRRFGGTYLVRLIRP
jgi:hypothetical protein